MLLKITWKRVLVAVVLLSGLTYTYLVKTNYFFDREIRRLANPLLREIMVKDFHRISEDDTCNFDDDQINIDVYKLLLKLTEQKKYQNINATMFVFLGNPITSMRFTGNQSVDSAFNNKKQMPCNTDKVYNMCKDHLADATTLFERNKNFMIYNFYYNDLSSVLHGNYFIKNMEKWPGRLIGKQIQKPVGIQNTRGWIINYGRYYYLTHASNIKEAHNDSDKHEHYLYWKKLTLKELMHYDNGSYWKLIKDYNIKID